MKKFTLPNGIRCLLNDTDCHQSVTVNIMFGVGSRDEPKDYYGLTHFAEHMFFKGTKDRPEARLISGEIDRHGGVLNATTDYDVTFYYVKIDHRKFEVALEVLSDMLFNALFRQKDINSEKEVVVNELKLYQNNPMRLNNMILEEMIYQGTDLEHDVGGDIETIRSATREQFLSFVAHYYQPSNTIVSIAGQIPGGTKKAMNLIEKYFNRSFDYGKQKHNGRRFRERKLFPKFIDYQKECRFGYKVKKGIDGSYLMIGFPGFKLFSPGYYALLVLSCILGRGMSSRLFIQVREKRGLAYRVGADVDAYQDLGILTIMCATHAKDIRKTFQVIWDELEKIKSNKGKGGVDQDELEKCQDNLIGVAHLNRENTSYLAKTQAYQTLYYGRVISIKEYVKNIRKVSLSEIKKIANQIFQKKKLNVSVVSSQKIDLFKK